MHFVAEPSGGPLNVSFPRFNTSSIFVIWSKPRENERNGIILKYSICHRIMDSSNSSKLCNDETITKNTWFELTGLKPYQSIEFQIKAATSKGFGPARVVSKKTLPAGKIF